jgi:hypothetical protein
MSIGMLWFDNDPKASLEEKVRGAAAYYREKYGKKPNTCFVSQKEKIQEGLEVDGIAVKTSWQITANHYWIGIDPAKDAGYED